VFQDGDNFSYRDVDFYTLSPTEADGRSARENIKNVAAAFRKVLEKVFSENCEDSLRIRDLFERLINSLPDSRPVWRLRLYVMSLCPDVFAEDLKNAFFRIFEVGDKYHEIDGGTEYQKTLRSCFKVLTEDEKRKYVENTFAYFIKQSEENPDEKHHLYSGWQNLSSISEHLTEAEKELCKEKFGIEIKNEFEPEPVMSQSRGGMISDRSPVNLSEYTVTEIVEHLKTDWTPKILDEKYKADDFLSPRNAQGLGDGIKSDLKERSESYLANAESFFDREHIHPHYTYSLLRSVEEMLRDKKLPRDFGWDGLFKLFEVIQASGESEMFDDEIEDGRWLSRWIPVHSVIADILLNILTSEYDDVFPFVEYRDKIFTFIKYLTKINDPKLKDETSEHGDLHGIAINSVRGRAFQVLTHFIHYDGRLFPEGQKNILNEDVKIFYLDWLKNETSKAVRYVFGHYLPPFYFRDKDWFVSENVIEILFDSGDSILCLSSWEGYLNQSVHEELFNILEHKYLISLEVKEEEGIKHGREKSFDELIGTHVALAFVHFEGFTLESVLFKSLWDKADSDKQKEFISFIGRHIAHKDDKWRDDNRVDVEKMKELWMWVLNNIDDSKVLSGFGNWVSHERDSFNIEWLVEQVQKTVVKSGGNVEWDYGIIQNLEKFAQVNPGATLDILEHYLLQGEVLNPHRERWFMIDRELVDTLELVHKDDNLKERVNGFINLLISAGGQQFWPLKNILS
jgi:hypothetical protein